MSEQTLLTTVYLALCVLAGLLIRRYEKRSKALAAELEQYPRKIAFNQINKSFTDLLHRMTQPIDDLLHDENEDPYGNLLRQLNRHQHTLLELQGGRYTHELGKNVHVSKINELTYREHLYQLIVDIGGQERDEYKLNIPFENVNALTEQLTHLNDYNFSLMRSVLNKS